MNTFMLKSGEYNTIPIRNFIGVHQYIHSVVENGYPTWDSRMSSDSEASTVGQIVVRPFGTGMPCVLYPYPYCLGLFFVEGNEE